jgi:hypothetical protein
MSDRKKLKYTITKAVMDQLPYNNTPIESHISEWWFTKSGDSLRLTPKGDFIFREAQIEYFDLPVNHIYKGFIFSPKHKLPLELYHNGNSHYNVKEKLSRKF